MVFHQVLEIIPIPSKVFCQPIQEFWMCRWMFFPKCIQWFHKTSTHKLRPDPVYNRGAEIRVFSVSDPLAQGFTFFLRHPPINVSIKKTWGNFLIRTRHLDSPLIFISQNPTNELVLPAIVLFINSFAANIGEKRSQAV